MNKSLWAAATLVMLFVSHGAWAQQKGAISKKQLVGAWTLVSAETVAKDGAKAPMVQGANPKGLLMFDGKRFSLQIMGDYPKIASNDRFKTTPEENRAVAHSVLSFFGTYSVSEADKVLALHIERSSFSFQNDTDAKRIITSLTADELKFTNPATAAGRVNNLVWKRLK